MNKNVQFEHLSKSLLGYNQQIKNPIRLNDNFFQENYQNMKHDENNISIEGLFCTMLFNPFGPTINLVGLIRNELVGVELLYHRSLNPFSVESYIVGACDDDYDLNIIDFFQNLFSGSGFNNFKPYKTIPTFVFPVRPDLFDSCYEIVAELYVGIREKISSFNNMMEKTQGNPWDFATLQIENSRSNSNDKDDWYFNEEDLEKYFTLVFNKKNIDAHQKSLHLAWSGAIRNSNGVCEMDLNILLKELIYSGCPIFAGKF